MARKKQKGGLRGGDQQQAALRDIGGGTYDTGAPDDARGRRGPPPTRHQRAQGGASVRDQPASPGSVEVQPRLPEGLRRRPKGPYSKDAGRKRS